jgi:acetyl-CoA carboxylase biotin carboxyl carrier protein
MRESEIRKLIAVLREYEDIAEIECVSGPLGFRRLKVSRVSAAAPVSAHIAAPSTETQEPKLEKESMEGIFEVTAPMVGTFYRASNPNSDPYVQEGSKVQSGTVLCIIEAMKLMNEIECGTRGTIQEVLVENGSPVEYGQLLMRIKED